MTGAGTTATGRLRSWVLAALLLTLAALSAPARAETYSEEQYAARLLELLNSTRADHGLVALQLASGTGSVAHAWSERLAADGALSHNPDLQHQLETHGSPDWGVFGENVGKGDPRDPDGLFDAYMQSPEHRENVLTPEYRYLGNAIVYGGAWAWSTMDFVDSYGAKPAPATASPRPRVSPPPAGSTTSTAPRRTTRGSTPPPPPTLAPTRSATAPSAPPLPTPPSASAPTSAPPSVDPSPAPAEVASGGGSVTLDPADGHPMGSSRSLPVGVAAVLLALVAAGWLRAARRTKIMAMAAR